jgi:hypothetical protein
MLIYRLIWTEPRESFTHYSLLAQHTMAEVSKVPPPLSQATGYGLILGLGAAFAVGMIGTTWALKRYHGEVQTSEAFSTANRTVKSGLVASAVVSSWTWAVSLRQLPLAFVEPLPGSY